MNEKGRQTKLLAAIAVLAMVVCAFAAVMPSVDADDTVSYGEKATDMNQTEFDKLIKDGVITISEATTWNLTGNIVSDNVTIVLKKNLMIQNTGENNYKFSIAYNGDAAPKGSTAEAAITTSGAESAVNLYINNVDAVFDNTTTNASWTINSTTQGLTVTVEDSNVQINKTADYVEGHGAIWQTATGTTKLNVIDSTIGFKSNGQGVQAMLVTANKSNINVDVADGTFSVYAVLDNSRITGDNVAFYGAVLKNNSSVSVTNLGVYTGTANSAAFSVDGLTLATVSMDAGSSVSATTIMNDLSEAATTNGSGTKTATFTGGSVSGELKQVDAVSGVTKTFTLSSTNMTDVTIADGTTVKTEGEYTGDVVAEIPADTTDVANAINDKLSSGASVIEVQGGTISGDVGTTEAPITTEIRLGSGVTITPAENDVPSVTFILGKNGSIVNDFSGDDFKVTYEGATATFLDFSGDVKIVPGSVTVVGQEGGIDGGTINADDVEVKIYGTLNGELTVKKTGNGSLNIADETDKGKTLVIEDGAELILDGFTDWKVDTTDAVLEIRGTLTSTATTAIDVNFTNGKIVTCPSTNLNKVNLKGTVEYKTDNIAYEFKGMLDQDFTISTEQSLTGDLWIPTGVTLTIASGGVLNMAGYGIYVQGTLDVQANGAVKNIGSGSTQFGAGIILLHRDGEILNEGVIGNGSKVTVSAAISTTETAYDSNFKGAGLAVKYTGLGEVTMQNVTGVTFSVKTDGDNRVLTISGDVYAYGISAPYNMSAKQVNVEETLTIGEDVIFTATGTVSIKSGATLNIEGKVFSNSNVIMKNGSTVNVEGTVDKITAETGNFVTAQKYQGATTVVTFDNVTGVVLTVGQTTYTEKNTAYTNQILYISGNPSLIVNNDDDKDGVLTIKNDNITGKAGISNVAAETKIVIDEGVTFNMGGTTVLGEVSYPKATNTGASNFVGTEYTIKGATASDDDVVYITTFANAYAQIANADKNTIKVWGELTIDFDVTLAAKQTIDIREATVEIDADATVDVQRSGAIINGSVADVQGVLTVYNGGNVKQPSNYAVYKKTTEYVQYSGLVPAINGAQPGDVIDVRNNTEVKDDLTIPAGVTVNNEATLTFLEDLTIAETAVLNNEGTVQMGGEKSTVTVNGTFNNEDGSTFGFYDVSGETPVLKTENAKGENRAVYSTGTTVMDENTRLSMLNFINAAYYNDEDGNVVLTTVAKAVVAVEAQDSGEQSVVIMGTVNQSEDITLADGTSIFILEDSKVTLGTVTLAAGAGIASYGELTATIAGQTGVEESTVASTIELSKAVAVIGMISYTGNDNVTTDYLVMYNAVGGDVTIASGKVNVLNAVDNNTPVKFTVNGTTLTVAAGATLAVEKIGDTNATLVAGVGEKADQPSIVVDGTILFDDGALEAYNDAQLITVNGTMTVADETEITIDGTVEILGTLAVSTTEDKAGTVTVADDGTLVVGDKPSDLGVAGAGVVTGAVETDNGILKAYNGANLTGAQIDINSGESDAYSTVFYINGQLYMTVYSCDADQVVAILEAEEFDIVGYVTERDSSSNPLDIGDVKYWYTDAAMSQSAKDVTDLGTPEALYFKAPAAQVTITVSVGEGISLYIDDVRQVTNSVTLAVGTHTVSAVVDPGFKGDVTITFNGTAITGSFTITPEMASNAYDGPKAISASGNITQDSTVVVDGGSSDSGMGLTDYLLIILVVLIVIMAIMVAMRLMRS